MYTFDTAEKVRYVDRALESAASALGNQAVGEQLGERTDILLKDLDRIIPILSSEDGANKPELLSPDAIPLLVISPFETISFGTGVNQFSGKQKLSAVKAMEGWQPGAISPVAAADFVENTRKYNPSPDTEHHFRDGAQAAQFSEDITVDSNEFRSVLSLQNGPDSELVKISFRSLLCLYAARDLTGSQGEALLHELTHLNQRERRPFMTFSTQQEFDEVAIRDELEAYHVGATVLATLAGQSILEMKSIDPGKRAQILIERSRLQSLQYDPDDPFKPNRMFKMLIDMGGLGLDQLIEGRVDVDQILANMGKTPRQPSSRVKKSGRYTPPKNKN